MHTATPLYSCSAYLTTVINISEILYSLFFNYSLFLNSFESLSLVNFKRGYVIILDNS